MDSWRTILASLAFVATMVFLAYYGYKIAQSEVAAPPCSEQGFPARCYHVPEKACEIAWSHAETSCKEFIKKLDLGPGRIVGPIQEMCQLANFDEQFGVSRKLTPDCNERHEAMIGWKRRNMN